MTTLPCEKFPRFFHPMIAPLSSFQPDKGRKILSSLADNPVIRWAAVGWKATKISKRPGPSWTRWRHFLLAQHGLFSNFYSGGKGGNWNGGAQVLLYTETRFQLPAHKARGRKLREIVGPLLIITGSEVNNTMWPKLEIVPITGSILCEESEGV